MREEITVYDARCCRVWPMPLEAFGQRGGRCGICGRVPESIGNIRTLKIHPPETFISNWLADEEAAQ